MRKVLKGSQFKLTKNTCFEDVLTQCALVKRMGQQGTWITNDMRKAYLELHKKGLAKSYEVWENDMLVGGLYGIDLGHVFCGESMFAKVSNASKVGFITFIQDSNYKLIDCQLHTKHLESLGAKHISRTDFLKHL